MCVIWLELPEIQSQKWIRTGIQNQMVFRKIIHDYFHRGFSNEVGSFENDLRDL